MRDGNPKARHPLTWGLFGGAAQAGEAPIHVAPRELREELGITIALDQLKKIKAYQVDEWQIHLFHYNKPLEWGEFKVLEGAGAAFLH